MEKYKELSTCKKCGKSALHKSFYNKAVFPRYPSCAKNIPESVGRICTNCGYVWQEEPLNLNEKGMDKKSEAFDLLYNW